MIGEIPYGLPDHCIDLAFTSGEMKSTEDSEQGTGVSNWYVTTGSLCCYVA